MLKALYVLSMLTGWGPAYQFGLLSYSAATHENQYYEILRLHRESQRLPESERSKQAQLLADKVRRSYESLKYLSFTQETIDLWCMEGSWRSHLPMEYWPKKPVATAHVAMTPEKVHTEISVRGRPLYSVFVKDMRLTEYRWPWNGMPGEYTSFPYNPVSCRLGKNIDLHLICVTGTLRRPFVGDASNTTWFKRFEELGARATNQPREWQRMMSEGHWSGLAEDRGVPCDLVVSDCDERRDVFFISQRGFVVLWYVIIRETPDHRSKWMIRMQYDDLCSDPIPDSEFSPSPALRELSRGWRRLSEPESQAELDEARAGS